MADLLSEGQLHPPAGADVVDRLSASLGIPLPGDYLDFLRHYNGGEGFVADSYLILWKAEELSSFNREYEVGKYAPGIFLFGSDGGGEGFGFDTEEESMPIVRIPFIGMDRRYATPVAPSFTELLDKLAVPE